MESVTKEKSDKLCKLPTINYQKNDADSHLLLSHRISGCQYLNLITTSLLILKKGKTD